jgi:hypothetical protein
MMKWFTLTDCANLGMERSLDGLMSKPGHYEQFNSEEELKKYLMPNWRYLPDENKVEIIYEHDYDEEKKLSDVLNTLVENSPELFVKGPSDSLEEQIKQIDLDGKTGVVDILHKVSCTYDINDDYHNDGETIATQDDWKRREDHITNLFANLQANHLYDSGFQINSDCCTICVYKSDNCDFELTTDEVNLLFSST